MFANVQLVRLIKVSSSKSYFQASVRFSLCGVAGLGKFVVLCHLVTTRKTELSSDERIEIIRYAKSRLPMFLKQLHQLLKTIKSTFSGMTSVQRFDIATYVVPEVPLSSLLFLINYVCASLDIFI